MPTRTGDVLSWATDIDPNTITQAQTTASMPFVHKPLALMPDAHVGMGSTVGSVVATTGAVIPACVGVDLGCGMTAQKLAVTASDLAADLDAIHDRIEQAVPAGIPNRSNKLNGSHPTPLDSPALARLLETLPDAADGRLADRAAHQFGTLGSGNHFVEVCSDENGDAWVVLHSGSRGPGNIVAQHHIKIAKGLMRDYFIELPDPDLAYLVEGTPQFAAYIDGMHWAQAYAFGNRDAMMGLILAELADQVDTPDIAAGPAISCHHNYCTRERHHGRDMWVTRKGAILARKGTMGVIPGSMASGSFIVEGTGSRASYESASHGAGRRMSRAQARKQLTADSLAAEMDGIAWNDDPDGLLDEHPAAYKDLGEVMAAQADLVEVKHRLETILNFKGA